MGGIDAPNWKISITTILTRQFLNLLTSKALWAITARSTLETNLVVKSNNTIQKINLYQALSNIISTTGWPRKWLPWIMAWKRSKGQYQDSYSSPFFQLKDFYIGETNATKYTLKNGHYTIAQNSSPYLIDKNLWILLWKLPFNNKEKEITWKFLTNSVASTRRMHFYQNISCIFCNSSNFDRQHLLSECTISKKILQQFSIHTHLFAKYGNWEELWLYN